MAELAESVMKESNLRVKIISEGSRDIPPPSISLLRLHVPQLHLLELTTTPALTPCFYMSWTYEWVIWLPYAGLARVRQSLYGACCSGHSRFVDLHPTK